MKKSVLKNGITLLTEHISSSHAISVGFWLKTGSIEEAEKENGYAHFLEHMIFKGTKKRSPEMIAQEIDAAGAYINAATSKEYTTYFINIIDSKIDLAMDILTDIIDNSVFDSQEIEKEKQVILEEIKMYEDTPLEQVQDNLTEAMLFGHPISNPILGRKKNIRKITKEKIKTFYNRHYYPENTIVTAAGNVDHDKIKEYLIRSKFLDKKHLPRPAEKRFAGQIKSKDIIMAKDLAQVHFCLGFPSIKITDNLRYALYIFNAIFGSTMSSRLFQKIRESMGLCYSIYSFNSLYREAGLFGIYTGTGIQSFEKALKAILEEISKIKKDKFTQKEISNAKEHLKGNLALAYENINTHMNNLARQEIYYEKHFTFDEIIKKIEMVRSEDVENAINLVFPDDYKVIIASIGNKNHKKILKKFDLII
ncbi:MAG: insulinase family protein [Spirochaetes bacterium]|nr:insulinase family protein [Spirochaetota bacterium]